MVTGPSFTLIATLYESSPVFSSTDAPGMAGVTRSRSSSASYTSPTGAATVKELSNCIAHQRLVVLPRVHVRRHAAGHLHLAPLRPALLEQLPHRLVAVQRRQLLEQRAPERE